MFTYSLQRTRAALLGGRELLRPSCFQTQFKQPFFTFSTDTANTEQIDASFHALVQNSYTALLDLPSKEYPEEVMKPVEVEEDEKFAVSTLGLWSLRTAYD